MDDAIEITADQVEVGDVIHERWIDREVTKVRPVSAVSVGFWVRDSDPTDGSPYMHIQNIVRRRATKLVVTKHG